MSEAKASLAASAESEALYREVGDKYGLAIAMLTAGDMLYSEAQIQEARKILPTHSLCFVRWGISAMSLRP